MIQPNTRIRIRLSDECDDDIKHKNVLSDTTIGLYFFGGVLSTFQRASLDSLI